MVHCLTYSHAHPQGTRDQAFFPALFEVGGAQLAMDRTIGEVFGGQPLDPSTDISSVLRGLLASISQCISWSRCCLNLPRLNRVDGFTSIQNTDGMLMSSQTMHDTWLNILNRPWTCMSHSARNPANSPPHLGQHQSFRDGPGMGGTEVKASALSAKANSNRELLVAAMSAWWLPDVTGWWW